MTHQDLQTNAAGCTGQSCLALLVIDGLAVAASF
jgi:hypothetical protein